MAKRERSLYGFLQSFTVLYMACKVRNSAVKNILKSILPQKSIAKNSHKF